MRLRQSQHPLVGNTLLFVFLAATILSKNALGTAIVFHLDPSQGIMVGADSRVYTPSTNDTLFVSDDVCKIRCVGDRFYTIAGIMQFSNVSFLNFASNACFSSPNLKTAADEYAKVVAEPLRFISTFTNDFTAPGQVDMDASFFGREGEKLSIERVIIVYTNGVRAISERHSFSEQNTLMFMGESGAMKRVLNAGVNLPRRTPDLIVLLLNAQAAKTSYSVHEPFDILHIPKVGSPVWILRKPNCDCR
jgi:hypothetical protein